MKNFFCLALLCLCVFQINLSGQTRTETFNLNFPTSSEGASSCTPIENASVKLTYPEVSFKKGNSEILSEGFMDLNFQESFSISYNGIEQSSKKNHRLSIDDLTPKSIYVYEENVSDCYRILFLNFQNSDNTSFKSVSAVPEFVEISCSGNSPRVRYCGTGEFNPFNFWALDLNGNGSYNGSPTDTPATANCTYRTLSSSLSNTEVQLFLDGGGWSAHGAPFCLLDCANPYTNYFGSSENKSNKKVFNACGTGGNTGGGCSTPNANISGSTSLCSGQSTNLSVNSCSGCTYQWSTGHTNNVISTGTLNSTKNYSVTVTNGSCQDTDSHTVSVSSCCTSVSISNPSDKEICDDESVTLRASGINGSVPITVKLYINNTLTQTKTINNSSTSFIDFTRSSSQLSAGSYTYYFIASNSCSSDPTSLADIDVSGFPNANISGSSSLCSGQSTNLSVNTCAGCEYQWSTGHTSSSISTGNLNNSKTYYVTVINSDGCEDEDSHTVSVSSCCTPVTISNPIDKEICDDESVTLRASGINGTVPITVKLYINNTLTQTKTINNSSTSFIDFTRNASQLSAGSYTYYFIASNSCSSDPTSLADIDVNGFPNPTISGPSTLCSGQSTILSVNTCAGCEYQWSTGQTSSSISTGNLNNSKTYYVTVINSDGCEDEDSHTVSVSSCCTPVTISNPIDKEICDDESVTLRASGINGSVPITVKLYINNTLTQTKTINNSSTSFIDFTRNASQLSAGSYTYYFIASNSCSSDPTSLADIDVNGFPNPTISGPSTLCSGQSTILSVNTCAGCEYQWSTGQTSSSISTGNLNNSKTYSVTVINSDGCEDEDSHTVSVSSCCTPVSISNPSDKEICDDESVTLRASGINGSVPITVKLYINNTLTQTKTINNSSTSFIDFTRNASQLSAGSYTYYFIASNSCSSDPTSLADIDVNGFPNPTISGPSTLCSGQSTILSVNTCAGCEYQWSTGQTSSSISTGNLNNSKTYSVTVINSDGCEDEDSHTVSVSSCCTPVSISNPSDKEICDDESVTLRASGINGSVPITVKLYINNTLTQTKTINNSSTSFIDFTRNASQLSAGSYTYNFIASNSCSSDPTSLADIDVNGFPNPTISGPSTLCSGQSTILSVNTCAGCEYQWSTGQTSSSISTGNLNNSKTYSVTVINSDGCEDEDSHTVSVSSCCTPVTISNPIDKEICDDESVTLRASGINGTVPITVKLYINNTLTQTKTINNSSTSFIDFTRNASQLSAGSYTYNFIASNSCSSDPTSLADIDVNGFPNPTISGPSTLCSGQSTILSVNTCAGCEYQWSTGQTSSSISTGNLNNSKTYSVTVINSDGCEDEDSHTVSVSSCCTPVSISNPSDKEICDDESVTLRASGINGSVPITVKLYINNTLTQTKTINNSSTSFIDFTRNASQLSAGSYTYYFIASNSCSSDPTSLADIDVNGFPNPTISGPSTLCSGQSTILSVNTCAGCEYQWSTGQTSSSISTGNLNNSKTYSVTVINSDGCEDEDSHTVSVSSCCTPVTISNPIDKEICDDESVTLRASGINGTVPITVKLYINNTLTQTKTINNSSTSFIDFTRNASQLSAGSYTYNFIASNSCSSDPTSLADIDVNGFPNPTISGPSTLCSGQSTILSVNTCAGCEYQWSTGQTSSSISTGNLNNSKTYSVTVINSDGCEDEDSHTIAVSSCCTPVTISNPIDKEICDDESVTLRASGINGTVPITVKLYINNTLTQTKTINNSSTSFIDFTRNASQLSAGSYTYNFIASNSCSNDPTSLADIDVNGFPNPTISGPSTLCSGQSTILSVNTCAGCEYQWSTGQTSSSISTGNLNNSKTYSVTVINSDGCEDEDSHTIAVSSCCTPVTISNPIDKEICDDESVTLRASGINGTVPITVKLYINNTLTQTKTINNSSTSFIDFTRNASQLSAGSYTYNFIASNSCSSDPTSLADIDVNGFPNPTISGPTSICIGQSTTLSANNCTGCSYSWTRSGNGSVIGTQRILTNVSNGTYTVTVTQNGCTASDSHTIGVNQLPSFTLDSPTTVFEGTPFTINVNSLTNCTGCTNQSISWSKNGDPITNGSISELTETINLPSGSNTTNFTYELTITNSDGCSHTDDITVSVLTTPTVSIDQVNPVQCGGEGSVVLSWDLDPLRTGIQFGLELDNGSVDWAFTGISENNDSPYTLPLPSGTHKIWTRWGDTSSPTFVEEVDILCEGIQPTVEAIGCGQMSLSVSDDCNIENIEWQYSRGNVWTSLTNGGGIDKLTYDVSEEAQIGAKLLYRRYRAVVNYQNCGQEISNEVNFYPQTNTLTYDDCGILTSTFVPNTICSDQDAEIVDIEWRYRVSASNAWIALTDLYGQEQITPELVGIYHRRIVLANSLLNDSQINVTSLKTTNSPTVANNQEQLCPGDLLSDISVSGSNLTWYDSEIGGQELPASTVAENTSYFVSQTVGSCESNRIPILVTIANPNVNITGPDSVCSGESATLEVASCEGCTYSWSTGETTTAVSLENLTSTATYSVTITQNNCEAIVNHTIEIDESPIFSLTTVPATLYENTPFEVHAIGLENCENCTAVWDPTGTEIDASGLVLTDIVDIEGRANLANVPYTLTLTNEEGCSHTETLLRIIRVIPEVTVESLSMISCGGDGFAHLTWIDSPSRTGIDFGVENNDGSISWTLNPVPEGSEAYDMPLPIGLHKIWTRWGDNSATTFVGEVEIQLADCTPMEPIISIDDQDCGIISLDNYLSYPECAVIKWEVALNANLNWLPTGEGEILDVKSLHVSRKYIQRSYYRSIVEIDGCESQISEPIQYGASAFLDVTECGEIEIINIDQGACADESIDNITWHVKLGSQPWETLTDFEGQYSILTEKRGVFIARMYLNDMQLDASRTINEIDQVEPPASENQEINVCKGTTFNQVFDGGNIMWYIDEEGSSEIDLTTPVSDGLYYVSQIVNSCESLKVPIQITVLGTITDGGTISASQTESCGPFIVELIDGSEITTPNSDLTVTYQWEFSLTGNSGTFAPIPNANGEDLDNPTMAEIGETIYYQRRVTLSEGCGDFTSNVLELRVNDEPSFTLSTALATVFEGDSFTINVNDLNNCTDCTNQSISWSKNGEQITNGSITALTELINLPPGSNTTTFTYELTITTGDGCSHTDNITVNVLTSPEVMIGQISADNCGGEAMVSLTWELDPLRTGIDFGLENEDGTVSWIHDNESENAGMFTMPLPVGTHKIWTRWGDNSAPTFIDEVIIDCQEPAWEIVMNSCGVLELTGVEDCNLDFIASLEWEYRFNVRDWMPMSNSSGQLTYDLLANIEENTLLSTNSDFSQYRVKGISEGCETITTQVTRFMPETYDVFIEDCGAIHFAFEGQQSCNQEPWNIAWYYNTEPTGQFTLIEEFNGLVVINPSQVGYYRVRNFRHNEFWVDRTIEFGETEAGMYLSDSPQISQSEQNVCSGSILADLDVDGTGLRWYDSALAGSELPESTLVESKTYYVSQILNNCESLRVPVTVVVQGNLEANISGPSDICSDETITLAVNNCADCMYSWSSGQTTSSITLESLSSTTTFSVTVTSASSTCSVVASHTVEVSNEPSFTLRTATTQIFESVPFTINVNNLENCTGCIATWNPVGTESNLESLTDLIEIEGRADLEDVPYSLTVTNEDGCEFSETILIRIRARPEVIVESTSMLSCGSEGIAHLSWIESPNRTGIDFGLENEDGTVNWIHISVDENNGLFDMPLAPGVHRIWARWGDNTAPTFVSEVVNECQPQQIELAVIGCGNFEIATDLSSCDVESIKWYHKYLERDWEELPGSENLESYDVTTLGTNLNLYLYASTYKAEVTYSDCGTAESQELTFDMQEAEVIYDECGNLSFTYLPTEECVEDFEITSIQLRYNADQPGPYAFESNHTAIDEITLDKPGFYKFRITTADRLKADIDIEVPTINSVNTPAILGGSSQELCFGNIISDLQVKAIEARWYNAEFGGEELPVTTLLENATYFVSQTINGCESARAPIEVSLIHFEALVNNTSPMVCQGTQIADLDAIGNGLSWFETQTAVEALSSTTVVENTIYYVSQIVSGCETVRVAIDVTIINADDPQVTDPVQMVCQGTQLSELGVVGTELTWFDAEVDGQELDASSEVESTTYYVSQTIDGCESLRVAIEVILINADDPQVADFAPSVCQGTQLSELGVVGTELTWFDSEVDGQELDASLEVESTTYYVSQTIDGCESLRVAIEVILINADDPQVADFAPSVCQGTQLSELGVVGTELTWFDSEVDGQELDASLEVESTTYYVSQTIDGCESLRVAIEVILINADDPQVADFAPSVCQGTQLSDLDVVGTELTWFDAEVDGQELDPSSEVESTTYYVSQTIDGCESPRVTIVVTVGSADEPQIADFTPTVCQGTQLNDLDVIGTELTWFDAEIDGQELDAATEVETTTYYVSETIDGCESPRVAIEVTIGNVQEPNIADLAPMVCQGTQLSDLDVSGTGLKWYDSEGTELPSETLAQSSSYFVSQSIDQCESLPVEINVTVTELSFELEVDKEQYSIGESFTINVIGLENCEENCSAVWSPEGDSNDKNGLTDIAELPSDGSNQLTYTLTINQGGNCIVEEEITITVISGPELVVSTVDAECGEQGVIQILVQDDANQTSLDISIDGGDSWMTYQDDIIDILIDAEVGNYEILARWEEGDFETNFGDFTISALASNVEIVNISVQSEIDDACPDAGLGQIEIVATGGSNLMYSIDGGENYQTAPLFSGIAEGDYGVIVLDNNSGCVATDVITVDKLFCDPCLVDLTIMDQTDELLENERINSSTFIIVSEVGVNQDIEIYGGEFIEINGPFEIEAGVQFLAAIEECECSEGALCDDGDPCTVDTVYDSSCNCTGGSTNEDCDTTDCSDGSQFNDPCDDGDPCTEDDFINAQCECVGTLNPDCNDSCTVGGACDDGDDCTDRDALDIDCNCVGIEIENCNSNSCPDDAALGSVCNDGDDCTENDVYIEDDQGACDCKGELIDENDDGICDLDEGCDKEDELTANTKKSNSCTEQQLSIVVNEFSNGETGSDEYIELLVKGGGVYDLRGVIIDDKEGAYQFGNGVSKGRIRFADHPNWSNVKGGSIILVYNNKKKHSNIPNDDPTDSDGNRIYTTPLAQPYFYGEQLSKKMRFYPIPPAWDLIWLYDKNDQINIRDCQGELLHRVSYGYPNEDNTTNEKTVSLKKSATKNQVYQNIDGQHSLEEGKPSPGKFNNRKQKRAAR